MACFLRGTVVLTYQQFAIPLTQECLRSVGDSPLVQLSQGGGALSTYTYGEVSPIFLGQDIVKSDIFGSKENLKYIHDIFLYQTSLN